MLRRPASGRTILLGTALVVMLVALQPVALGFFPVGGSDGASIGTGDLTAGALSALVRDMNTEGAAPPQARSASPVVLVLLGDYDADDARRAPRFQHVPAAPATTRAGASDHGFPLLL